MTKNYLKFLILTLFLTFSFTGTCFSFANEWRRVYEGPPVSSEKTAVLYLRNVMIIKANNKVFNYWNCMCELLPGKYDLEVKYFQLSPKTISEPVSISFEAKPGRNYILTGIFETKERRRVYFTPYIEDITAQEYKEDASHFKKKEYYKLRKAIKKTAAKQKKSYEKFLSKIGSFEPVKMSFYEYDGKTIPKNIKANTAFQVSSARYIIAELKVRNTNPGLGDQTYNLNWQYYFPRQTSEDGEWMEFFEICTQTSTLLVRSDKEYSFSWVSWGSTGNDWIWEKGKGKKGTIIVNVSIEGKEIYEDRFILY